MSSASMKQATINPDLTVEFENGVSIPVPSDWEVVIKVKAASINPIDWKASSSKAVNDHKPMGLDVGGIVHAVGAKAFQFKVGDRVAGFNYGTGFAEYSISPSSTTVKLPDHVPFEEAAAFGVAYYTAALGMFKDMPTPSPWTPARPTDHNPLLIYGASSAVGAYAVKLAVLANIHPIVAVAGAAANDTIAGILRPDLKDIVIDYREHHTPESLLAAIEAAIGGPKAFKFAYDAISSKDTLEVVARVCDPQGSYLVYTIPESDVSGIPTTTQSRMVLAPLFFMPKDPDGAAGANGESNIGNRAFASVTSKFLELALGEGLLKVHPYEVLPGGLCGLQQGLQDVKLGKHKSRKYIMRTEETKW